MRTAALTGLSLISAVLVSAAAPGQTGWRRWLPTVAGDLAITKERAERGDVSAQVGLANDLAGNGLAAQAVEWYRKAAEQGNVEAKYRLGDILINGVSSLPDPAQCVKPDPTEGVRWTFEAATNFHTGACRNMSYVLENGIGLERNLVEAYAWLEVYARSNASDARAALDHLALRMDLAEIRESHALAGRFFNRQWPPHHIIIPKFTKAELALKLTGLTIGPVSLAIINGQTFEKGDSVVMPAKEGTARVTCVNITKDSVLVAVEGEEEPRALRLK